MKNIFFTGVFLETILSTATSNKNVSKELEQANLTASENGNSVNITKREKYNAYVNAEVQEIWEKYLAQVEMTEFKPLQNTQRKTKEKWTTATATTATDSAVTETLKAFGESGNNPGREAASNIDFTRKPGAHSFAIGENRTVFVMRQATQRMPEEKDRLDGAIQVRRQNNPKIKSESYRQPYWKDGDYVFLRTGSPTIPPKDRRRTTNPMEIFRDCDRTCNYYFKTYGRVCGHRYSTKYWRNEYKNFANICDVDHENCIHTHSRPNWHPMYRGNCSELLPFPKMEYDFMGIVDRAKKWAPYVYKPPRPTPTTEDPVDKEIRELQKNQ